MHTVFTDLNFAVPRIVTIFNILSRISYDFLCTNHNLKPSNLQTVVMTGI